MALLTIDDGVDALVPSLNALGSAFAMPTVSGQPITFYLGSPTGAADVLQVSSTQLAIEYPESVANLDLVMQGSGLSMPSSAMSGNPNLSAIQGIVTAAQLYSGGSFGISMGVGSQSGGTLVASATFSATQCTITVGGESMTINGSNLPTNAAAVASILQGTYVGAGVSISSIQFVEGPNAWTLALTATTLTLTEVSGLYQLTLTGSFPTSLTAAQLDALATGQGFYAAGLSGDITGATITTYAHNTTVLSFTGIPAPGIPLTDLQSAGFGSIVLGLLSSLFQAAGGTLDVTDTGGTVLSGTTTIISAGQTDIGDSLVLGNEFVTSGGLAVATVVGSGADLLESAGTAIDLSANNLTASSFGDVLAKLAPMVPDLRHLSLDQNTLPGQCWQSSQ